ncbi:hypothetical protein PENSUB_10271 [Penicillium subrubescens]|uniref:Uncharacterized protein n=1 Tax=Penicillium subrubescens TaxID=1316194 RepID=A0A1Q5TB98_9EURO|nr:hypothetical protein PENSUB_10271 [Penicillium subrubescens]
METGAEELIHQWLANVPEGATSQPDYESLNAADLEPNGGLSTALEPTDTGPAIRWPKINKRPRDDNADHGQQGQQDSTGNQYEKRPRRKTRDDKYEYKRPSFSRQRTSQPHKARVQRSRKNRKHTMNDAFHATNVARDRLTLRNTMNMGIFSKGKASSPIKLRDVPDSAFSEAQFLSHKERGQPGTGTGKGTTLDESPLQKKPDGKHTHPRVSHYDFHEPPKLRRTETYIGDNVNPSVQFSQGDQWHPSGSNGVVPTLPAAGPTTPDRLEHIPGKAHDINSPLRRSVQEPPSPTPYTWSVSDRHGSQRSREVEDRLLKILHVGLSPQKSGHQDEPVDSMNGHFNIQNLKSLLESRKACWQPEASLGLHSLGGVSIHKTPEFFSGLSGTLQSPTKGSASQLKRSDAVSKSKNRAGPREASPDDVFRHSWHNQSPSHEVDVSKKVPLLSEPRLRAPVHQRLAGLDVGDDDIFFQKLDEAYCATFEPDGTKINPLNEDLVECNKGIVLLWDAPSVLCRLYFKFNFRNLDK